MRARILAVMAALVAALVWLAPAAPATVEAQSSSAAALHRDAIVVDGHVHITNRVYWEGMDPWQPHETGLWDYARAKQGGLDVVVEQVYIEDPFNNYNYAVKQACRLIERFYQVLEANKDRMELALTSADARRIVASGKMAVILALEGGFDMEGDLDVLRLFHRLGVRLIQLSNHNTTNAFADAGLGEQKWGGVNDLGRKVIREMNRLGILIDVSHASDAAQLQAIEASAAPVVASHHGLRDFSSDAARNFPDKALIAMAAKGGLIGIHSNSDYLSKTYYREWSRGRPAAQRAADTDAFGNSVAPPPLVQTPDKDYGRYITALDAREGDNWRRSNSRKWRDSQQQIIATGAPLATVEDWLDNADYAVKLVGEDHVGIGLDMMTGGSQIRGFDATGYPRFTEAMVARGYSETRIRKILGENWLRLFDSAKVDPDAGPR
jgi:membrane dipeptidase